MIVIAPCIEEYLFRGTLPEALRPRWSGRAAVIASSLIFALLHFDPLGSFVFAIALAALRTLSGGLVLPIVVHAANNAVAMILERWDASADPTYPVSALAALLPLWPWAVALAVVGVLLVIGPIRRAWNRDFAKESAAPLAD